MREKTRLVLKEHTTVQVVPVYLDKVQIMRYPGTAWETRLWTGGTQPTSILFQYDSEASWREHFDWLAKVLFAQDSVAISNIFTTIKGNNYLVHWTLEN